MIAAQTFDKQTVLDWLQARGPAQQQLFEEARAVRAAHGGDEVLLRGVIEISNHCDKRCRYCAMRRPNQAVDRYRMEAEQVLAIARQIREAGIGTAFLQAGQDLACDELLDTVIPIIKQEMGMNVLLCVGERPAAVYQHFAQLGADAYILKFETSQPELYHSIAEVPARRRVACMQAIREAGLKLGTGNIVGLPDQNLDHVAEDFFFALGQHPDFVSAAPFIPNEGTPFERAPSGDLDTTLNLMALWRIALGHSLIPSVSALEKLRPDGQLAGFQAGANVMTINFTPADCRAKYAIYSEKRFVVSLDHALHTIARAGLRVRKETPAVAAA